MKEMVVPIKECKAGQILATNVYNDSGVTLIGQHAMITEYIKNKLIEFRIPTVRIYEKTMEDPNRFIKHCYLENIAAIKKIFSDLLAGKKLEYKEVINLSESLYCGIKIGYRTLKILNEVQGIDDYTYSHCINTAFYSMLIGKWLGFTEPEIKKVIQCGLLHDIGKCQVPLEVLNKKGVLTREEFQLIQKHTILGYGMLDDIEELNTDIRRAVLMHHERIDGSGYPLSASSESLGIYARIVAVADVYDAMTSDRIYKKRATPFEVFEMFLTVGIGIFDMGIVNVFLKNIAYYYTGVKLLLSNGEIGEVVFIPPQDILHPIILISTGYIDLAIENDLKIARILPEY